MLEPNHYPTSTIKTHRMADALLSQIEQPGTYEGLSFEQRIQLLADSEAREREQRKQKRLIKAARFKLAAHAQDIDYLHPGGLQQSVMASLLQCDWLTKLRTF